jgi:adenylate kinase family enzyme
MIALFLNGIQGGGKDTQGNLLRDNCGYLHIVAKEILEKKAKNDELYRSIVTEHTSRGTLVPDKITVDVIIDYIEEFTTPDKNLVLNGCMRTPNQARALLRYTSERGYDPLVVFLELSEDVARERLRLRGRSDDVNQKALAERLTLYHHHQSAILQAIVTSGHSIHVVNGDGSPENVFKHIHRICKFAPHLFACL